MVRGDDGTALRGKSHAREVGIMMGKEAASALISWEPINDRIITVRLKA